jgi:hypothetical protein
MSHQKPTSSLNWSSVILKSNNKMNVVKTFGMEFKNKLIN